MNILWDFRLFSYGYGSRGVGAYASAMADAIGGEKCDGRIFMWGEKDRIPPRFHSKAARWIDYVPRSWKSDLVVIPMLIAKYRIDLLHYWMAPGPIFRMGLGLIHPCRTCLTVHDLGVEFWGRSPMCASTKRTLYWKIQKLLFPRADGIVCNSRATQADIERLFKDGGVKTTIMYPPIRQGGGNGKVERKNHFVTLDGEAHKNTDGVVKAFEKFRRKHPDFSLLVLGEGTAERGNRPGVSFESMRRYPEYLENAAGLVACSFYEGLGLPALEAMERGCPIVVSDIPAFRETCGDAAVFVDPNDVESIARGMERCAASGKEWSEKSSQGAVRYMQMCGNAGEKWMGIYWDIMRTG